jgi:hypothetical protein
VQGCGRSLCEIGQMTGPGCRLTERVLGHGVSLSQVVIDFGVTTTLSCEDSSELLDEQRLRLAVEIEPDRGLPRERGR